MTTNQKVNVAVLGFVSIAVIGGALFGAGPLRAFCSIVLGMLSVVALVIWSVHTWTG